MPINKFSWLLLAILSLVIGLYLAFDTFSIGQFIVFTISFWLFIFIAGISIVKVVKSIGEKNIKKLVLFAIVILFSLVLVWFLSAGKSFLGIATATPHYRTNILTGRCDLGPLYDTADFWYYRFGCTASKDEKIILLRSSPLFSGILDRCQKSPSDTSVLGSVDTEVRCIDFIK